jgi:hypothetical protein
MREIGIVYDQKLMYEMVASRFTSRIRTIISVPETRVDEVTPPGRDSERSGRCFGSRCVGQRELTSVVVARRLVELARVTVPALVVLESQSEQRKINLIDLESLRSVCCGGLES